MGIGSSSISQSGSGASGNFTLVEKKTLSSAGDTFDFTGLDSDADGNYFLVIDLKNATATQDEVHVYVNGDNTDTNYWAQTVEFASTGVTASRVNEPRIAILASSNYASITLNVLHEPIDGMMTAFAYSTKNQGSIIGFNQYAISKINAVTKITQITIQCDTTGSSRFATGSTATLYKMTEA